MVVEKCRQAGRILLEVLEEISSRESVAKGARASRRVSALQSVTRHLLQIKMPEYRLSDRDLNIRTAKEVDSAMQKSSETLSGQIEGVHRQVVAHADLSLEVVQNLRTALDDCQQALESISKVELNPLYESMVSIEATVYKSADLIGKMLGILESRDADVLSTRQAKRAAVQALDVLRSLR